MDTALLLKIYDDVIDKISMKKHEWVLCYMEDICSETIQKYKGCKAPDNLNFPNKDIKVWSMWWQGESEAAPLFKMCIDRSEDEIESRNSDK